MLLAIAASDLSFIYVNIGAPGSESDAGIWDRCKFKELMDHKKITFPQTPENTIRYHLIGMYIHNVGVDVDLRTY